MPVNSGMARYPNISLFCIRGASEHQGVSLTSPSPHVARPVLLLRMWPRIWLTIWLGQQQHCRVLARQAHAPPHAAAACMQLIGYLAATAGEAFINGTGTRAGMAAIHRIMGVCPQDNLLWETLTAREHLLFYGRLKGLRGHAAAAAADQALRSVSLHDRRNSRASSFSGGVPPPPRYACAGLTII